MSENSNLEIPEKSAPPLEALVEGEGAPGNPETRAQIQVPEVEEIPEKKPEIHENSEIDSKNWVDVAKGKRGRGRPPKKIEEIPLEKKAELEAAKIEKERANVEKKIRANKASGIVTVSELGLLYLARRFGAQEDEIAFRPDEKKALQEAIEPLVSVESEDPWGNLLMVAMAVGGPRVATIAAARQSKLAAEVSAPEEARWRAVA